MNETQTIHESDPSEGNPFITQAADSLPRPAVTQEATTDTPSPAPRRTEGLRMPTGKEVVAGTVGFGAIAAGVIGLSHIGGGADTPPGTVSTSIESIDLNNDATLRVDPVVNDDVLGPNSVLHLEEPVSIDITKDMRIVKDNDGVVWVNQQGVDSVKSDQ